MRRPERAMWIGILGLLLARAPLAADKPIAELVAVAGGVNLTRAVDGRIDVARMLGTKVRNGSIHSGDEVATEKRSTARLLLADGSVLELKEETRLTVEKDLPAKATPDGAAAKATPCTVFVLSGVVQAKVAPGEHGATRFETPLGQVAVSQATFTLTVRAAD